MSEMCRAFSKSGLGKGASKGIRNAFYEGWRAAMKAITLRAADHALEEAIECIKNSDDELMVEYHMERLCTLKGTK